MTTVTSEALLTGRIRELEAKLRERPTQHQLDAVREENERLESLYWAAIRRCEILAAKCKKAGLE